MGNYEAAASIDLASLAKRARDAYDQKRTKECLTLTKSLLIADPENTEGQSLQAAIRSDIQRNLDDARALLADSRRHENLTEHRKAAEILLLKILYLDPSHGEAKNLLNVTKGVPQAMSQGATHYTPVPGAQPSASLQLAEPAEAIFAVEYRKPKPVAKKGRSKTPLAVATLALVVGVLIVTGQSHFKSQAPVASAVVPKQIETQKDFVPTSNSTLYPVATIPEPVVTVPEVEVLDPVPAAVEKRPTPAVIVPGTLAVSSPTSAEIYRGTELVGSTPTTLELPPGTHTLEYRHGDLRQSVTHVIKPKETTTAMVTFDVTVQVNARPWAQVSVGGTQRRPLGQTPLSDVKIPIGSTLVFENPNFPVKTYRVTGKETAIQIVFP